MCRRFDEKVEDDGDGSRSRNHLRGGKCTRMFAKKVEM